MFEQGENDTNISGNSFMMLDIQEWMCLPTRDPWARMSTHPSMTNADHFQSSNNGTNAFHVNIGSGAGRQPSGLANEGRYLRAGRRKSHWPVSCPIFVDCCDSHILLRFPTVMFRAIT